VHQTAIKPLTPRKRPGTQRSPWTTSSSGTSRCPRRAGRSMRFRPCADASSWTACTQPTSQSGSPSPARPGRRRPRKALRISAEQKPHDVLTVRNVPDVLPNARKADATPMLSRIDTRPEDLQKAGQPGGMRGPGGCRDQVAVHVCVIHRNIHIAAASLGDFRPKGRVCGTAPSTQMRRSRDGLINSTKLG
jgi:hypothetical protein